MDEIRHEGFSGLATSHIAMPTLHEICLAHPDSFQSTQMNIDNFEKAIVQHTHSLYSVKQICELPSGANKAETDQQRNESRIKTLDENQIEVRNHLYTLNGKLDELTVPNIAAQNELRFIQCAGLISSHPAMRHRETSYPASVWPATADPAAWFRESTNQAARYRETSNQAYVWLATADPLHSRKKDVRNLENIVNR